jgi:hypothetical protein
MKGVKSNSKVRFIVSSRARIYHALSKNQYAIKKDFIGFMVLPLHGLRPNEVKPKGKGNRPKA